MVDGVQYGEENEVYGNLAGGIKILVDGQAIICGNQLWDNAAGDITGTFAGSYSSTQPCETDA